MIVCFSIDLFSFSQETTTREGEEEEEEKPKKGKAVTGGKPKKLTNQFNFSERASQTYNNPCRVNAFLKSP